jgi:hypothetical protein
MALRCMVGCFVCFLSWLRFHANLPRVEFNAARPGRRNLTNSPAGSGLSPFQGKVATIDTIANTGAMLLIGQERSRDSAALAVESRCNPIVLKVTKAADSRRVSGSYNRRDRGGRLLLTEMLEVRILPGEPTPLSGSELRNISRKLPFREEMSRVRMAIKRD